MNASANQNTSDKLILPESTVEDMLKAIVQELLPEEFAAGHVRVIREYAGYEDDNSLYSGVYVSYRAPGKRSLVILEVSVTKSYEEELYKANQLDAAKPHVWNWEEGTMPRQSFIFMKAHLIAARLKREARITLGAK